MPQLTTNIKNIHKFSTLESYDRLLKSFGTTDIEEPIPFSKVLDVLGLVYTSCVTQEETHYDKEWRLYAVWCARGFNVIMENELYRTSIDVAERFSHGNATEEELAKAHETISNLEVFVPKGLSLEKKLAYLVAHTLLPNAGESALTTQIMSIGSRWSIDCKDSHLPGVDFHDQPSIVKESYEKSRLFYKESFRHLVDTGELPPLVTIS